MEFIENVTRFYTTEKFEEFDHDTLLPVTGDQHPLAIIAEDVYCTLSKTVITPPGEEDIPTPAIDLPEKDTFLTNLEQLPVGETLRINSIHKNDQHYALIEKVDDNHILFFNGPYSKSDYKTKDINETDKNYFHEHDVVVDSKGNFIGILANIQNKLANIMLASDFISKIPAKAIGSNISLILEGKGNDILEIKHFLGKKENIRVGDRVYTSSSNDNIFYSGIYIGDIVSINNKLYVKLAANLNSLDYVVILHRMFNSNFLE